MKIFLIILILLSNTIKAQVIKITAYHFSFFDPFPYSGGPYQDQIKTFSRCRKYVSRNKQMRRDIDKYLSKLDTSRDYISLTGAEDVQLLIEVKYLGGKIKKIYAWNNGEMFYNQKLFKRDEYFINLIEKNLDI